MTAPRCEECENRPGANSVMHADGCPNESCFAFLMGNFERAPVEVCGECSWKDGYHKWTCSHYGTRTA